MKKNTLVVIAIVLCAVFLRWSLATPLLTG